MPARIGVDVGGTFTDLIYLDERTGAVRAGKGPSRPAAVDEGVRAVVTATLSSEEIAGAEYFLHGTTVGLNALLERAGARVGLLTTSGFRDILEVRRLLRIDERGHRLWDAQFRAPEPLVPRHLRLGVDERMTTAGEVFRPLEPASVLQAAEVFADEGVECVAIVFMNAHANPEHELRAAELLREAGFDGPLSLSHRVSGQYREYERTSTTVIDAYVRPAVSSYLERLGAGLAGEGFAGECLITTSSGGCVAFAEAEGRPFETVMSGPVAGAVGAGRLCRDLGLSLAITADVGGTSFDTCLLVDGRPQVKHEGEVVGMPLQTPWVDVRSVGAGGGSIAYVERGLLFVGPRSAGADPGPVCYGHGGVEPTVTDAAVVLGMLARDTLASGLRLDKQGSHDALERIGAELGLEAEEAARGVLQVAAANMASAIRAVSIEVGEDPREAALLTYGGAGPLFASLLARELGIGTIVLPNYAGNFSAWGLLEQDMVRTAALTVLTPLDDGGLRLVEGVLAQLFERLDERRAQNTVPGTVLREAELDLRYPGQEYHLTMSVRLEDGRIADSADDIAERFGRAYERSYGHRFDQQLDVLAVRAIERTVLPRDTPDAAPAALERSPAPHLTTRAWSFARGEWCDFAVVDRDTLRAGDTFAGPAIVLEATATSYFDAGLTAEVDSTGTLIVTDGHAGFPATVTSAAGAVSP